MAAEVAARLAVRSALGSLTARQRTVLVLRVFDDLSEAQAAQLHSTLCSSLDAKQLASAHTKIQSQYRKRS
jgi:DNA-directed RNA polymerase specialized sigma24 family protein